MNENQLQYLVHYEDDKIWKGRICLFDSHINSVEQIIKFNHYESYEVTTTKDKVSYFICHCQFCKLQIFAIRSFNDKSFEIFDLNTRQITKGRITKPNRLVYFIAFLQQVQILLHGVQMHLWLISKINCIIWVDGNLKN